MTALDDFYAYLMAAQQGQFAGKPGEQLNTGDMSSILSKNMGLLTNTLTDTNISDDDIYNSYAPDIARVRTNPDSDVIATEIVEQLGSGMSVPQVLKNLRSKGLDKEDLSDYKEYVTNVAKQMGDVSTQMSKRTTPASEAGLPEPGAPFNPDPSMKNIFAYLQKQAQPVVPPVAKKYKDLSTDERKDLSTEYTKNNERSVGDLLKGFLTFRNPNQIAYERKTAPNEANIAKDNAYREKVARQEGIDVRKLVAASMERNSLTGSPFGDDFMKRTIMKKLLENPAAISKLIKSQG